MTNVESEADDSSAADADGSSAADADGSSAADADGSSAANAEEALAERLMAQVRDGSVDALESLYDMLGPSVMRFLARLCGDRGLAEDLTQETFVRVWDAAARWEPRAQVRTWMFEIARRLAWNEMAKRQRRAGVWRQVSQGPSGIGSAGSGAKQAFDQEPEPGDGYAALDATDVRNAISQAVMRLTPRLRVVFVLLRLEGCSLRETAMIAAIPEGTVKSRAAAAEARLRVLLRNAGFLD